jgi:2-oxoglutarate ferredoxin oxidoreductase subunit beta
MAYLQQRAAVGEIVTGLLYAKPESADLHDSQQTVDIPLNMLDNEALVPGSAALAAFNAANR